MTKERIEQIREGKEKARRRQDENYQATGEARYDYAARRYEELVEICDQALSTAEDHTTAVHLRVSLCSLASRADKALHHADEAETKQIMKDILAIAEDHGYKSPWR